jgi:hypothetical protein
MHVRRANRAERHGIAVAVVLSLVALGGCSKPSITIHGKVQGGTQKLIWADCGSSEKRGVNPVEGLQVTVKDASGRVIGTTSVAGRATSTYLYSGQAVGTGPFSVYKCDFTGDYSVRVPRDDFYTVSLGGQSLLPVSYADLQAKDFELDLTRS